MNVYEEAVKNSKRFLKTSEAEKLLARFLFLIIKVIISNSLPLKNKTNKLLHLT